MKSNLLSKQQIEDLNYTDFISLIKETNRCPGGKDTIRKIIQNSFINKDSNVLEIGSNTGFTSLEIAHLVKCKINGIDVSKSCVKEANERLSAEMKEVKNNVSFQIGSAYDIPFKDNSFDLVVAGGATSFMDKKQKAVSEYLRVTKPWGFISITQLFYKEIPPKHVIEEVSKAIGVEIKAWGEKEWLSVFTNRSKNLELYYYEPNSLESRSETVIKNYIDYFMAKPHMLVYSEEIRDAIRRRWKSYIDIFNENHKYLGYFIALFRKTAYEEEPELFIRSAKNGRL